MLGEIIADLSNWMYTYLLVILLVAAGLFFTIRNRFPQLRLLREAIRVVVERPEKEDNIALAYSPSLIGDIRVPTEGSVKPLALSYKKVITRRAVMELQKGSLVNLGIGIPAGVANVANEEGLSEQVTLSLETGIYGGVPLDGPLFGASVNPDSITRSSDMFTTYDGGGLDMTVRRSTPAAT